MITGLVHSFNWRTGEYLGCWPTPDRPSIEPYQPLSIRRTPQNTLLVCGKSVYEFSLTGTVQRTITLPDARPICADTNGTLDIMVYCVHHDTYFPWSDLRSYSYANSARLYSFHAAAAGTPYYDQYFSAGSILYAENTYYTFRNTYVPQYFPEIHRYSVPLTSYMPHSTGELPVLGGSTYAGFAVRGIAPRIPGQAGAHLVWSCQNDTVTRDYVYDQWNGQFVQILTSRDLTASIRDTVASTAIRLAVSQDGASLCCLSVIGDPLLPTDGIVRVLDATSGSIARSFGQSILYTPTDCTILGDIVYVTDVSREIIVPPPPTGGVGLSFVKNPFTQESHIAYVEQGIVKHRRLQYGNVWSSATVIASGVNPSLLVLHDGALHCMIQDSATRVMTVYRSVDNGMTWGIT